MKLNHLFSIALLFSLQANSAEVEIRQHNPISNAQSKNPFIYLKGDIKTGDFDKLIDLARKNPETFMAAPLVIASNGGDVAEAIKISELIKKTFKAVIVTEGNGNCLSACFYIVASAATRYIDDGKIGVHRPYLTKEISNKLSVNEYAQAQSKLLNLSKAYLKNTGIPEYLIDIINKNSSNGIYWLTNRDKDNLGFRANWYEQYLITVCGLDNKMEDLYFKTNDENLREKFILPVLKCEADKVVIQGYKNLLKELNGK